MDGASCIIDVVVGVVCDDLGLRVGPVCAGVVPQQRKGDSPGTSLSSSLPVLLLPPTSLSVLPLLLLFLLLLGYPHAWCETVIGLLIVAVQGISQSGDGGMM